MAAHSFDAVVFDLDGVIVDTEVSVFDAWCTVFERYGCEISLEDWNRTVGSADGGRVVYELLCERATGEIDTREKIRLEIRELQYDLFDTMRPLPGVEGWIEQARSLGLGLAVASSSSFDWVRSCLETVGLAGAFSSLHCPDENNAAKPRPDLYLAACRTLGVKPGRAIAVEDSHNGLCATVEAGLVCVAVPNSITRGADFTSAHHQVASLDEISLLSAMNLLAESRTAAR